MRRLPAIALGFATLAGASAAHAADYAPPVLQAPPPVVAEPGGGWYLRGDIGAGATTARSWTYTPDPPLGITGGSYRHSISSAVFIGAGIGYAFNSWLRADLTFEYRGGATFRGRDDLVAEQPNGNDAAGYQNNLRASLSSYVTLVNAYVDLGTWYGITPFVGAGIGFAHNRLGVTSDTGTVYFNDGSTAASAGTIGAGSRTNLAWALMAGLAYDISPAMKVELGYRYLNLGRFQSGAPCATTCGNAIQYYSLREVASHDVRLGLRYSFGGVASAPAPIVARY